MIRSARPIVVLALLTLLGACQTRSISDSGYRGWDNRTYRGELSDMDVIGVNVEGNISEADVKTALMTRQEPTINPRHKIALIQSGALVPDAPLLDAMKQKAPVFTLSGIPHNPYARAEERATYSPRALRLAAARAGARTLICVWGVLESQQEALGSKAISWIPIVGWAIPDEEEQMRLRLRMIIVDVATGAWKTFEPTPVDGSAVSSSIGRESTDQDLVETLKAQAYAEGVEALFSGRNSQIAPAFR